MYNNDGETARLCSPQRRKGRLDGRSLRYFFSLCFIERGFVIPWHGGYALGGVFSPKDCLDIIPGGGVLTWIVVFRVRILNGGFSFIYFVLTFFVRH